MLDTEDTAGRNLPIPPDMNRPAARQPEGGVLGAAPIPVFSQPACGGRLAEKQQVA